MISNIATAAVYVENQNEDLEFWTEKVGFVVHREKRMSAEASWIEVGPKGARSCLVIFPKTMMANWSERKPSIVFDCDSVKDTYTEMNARGVIFSQTPQAMGWGTFAIFTDPEGNSFGLREPDKLVDPFGHEWGINQQLKEQTDEETQAAAGEYFASGKKQSAKETEERSSA